MSLTIILEHQKSGPQLLLSFEDCVLEVYEDINGLTRLHKLDIMVNTIH